MTYLYNSADCPACGSDHKGKPYCTYENGVHCFSCRYTKSYDRTFSISESRIQPIPDQPDAKSNPAEFSLENLVWLNKYFIMKEDITKHHILEAQNGALIFCTIQNNKIVHYQTRLNIPKRIILSYGTKIPAHNRIGSSTVVLVEDFISYIRLSELCDVVCLWGTKTSYNFLESLLTYSKVLVWLDNDQAKETNSGQENAKIICKMLQHVIQCKLSKFGFGDIEVPKVTNIVTNCDPKCYSPSEIKKILGSYL